MTYRCKENESQDELCLMIYLMHQITLAPKMNSMIAETFLN